MRIARRATRTLALLILVPLAAIACADGESVADPVSDSEVPSEPHPSGDTEPPRLITADFFPKQVSVSGQTELVEITASLEDDVTGVTLVLALFSGPHKTRFTQFAELKRVSGDRRNGEFRGSLGVDQSAGTGIWTLILIRADDGAGNTARYDTDDLQDLGVPVKLTVSG